MGCLRGWEVEGKGVEGLSEESELSVSEEMEPTPNEDESEDEDQEMKEVEQSERMEE